MLQIKVNEKLIHVWKEGNTIVTDSGPCELDMITTAANSYHILHKNTTYNAEVIGIDLIDKLLTLKINHQIFHISIKDKSDLLLQKIGIVNKKTNAAATVNAPMPGLIIKVSIVPGQAIKSGESILILEAMKMENIIKAQSDCIVQSIHVAAGNHVEKNQLLVSLEI